MNADHVAPAQPPAESLPEPTASAKKPRRQWTPPAPPSSSRTFILIFAATAMLAIIFIAALYYFYRPVPQAPALAAEFRDEPNFYGIRPPRYWVVDDRKLKDRLIIQGPREPRFNPLITVSNEPAPGNLKDFVANHKTRIKIEDPSIVFLSESTESIDGREAVRLEYESDYTESPEAEPFKLRTIRFIVHDQPYYLFYKITCHARAATFDEHKAVFELSARSFHLLAVRNVERRYLNE